MWPKRTICYKKMGFIPSTSDLISFFPSISSPKSPILFKTFLPIFLQNCSQKSVMTSTSLYPVINFQSSYLTAPKLITLTTLSSLKYSLQLTTHPLGSSPIQWALCQIFRCSLLLNVGLSKGSVFDLLPSATHSPCDLIHCLWFQTPTLCLPLGMYTSSPKLSPEHET